MYTPWQWDQALPGKALIRQRGHQRRQGERTRSCSNGSGFIRAEAECLVPPRPTLPRTAMQLAVDRCAAHSGVATVGGTPNPTTRPAVCFFACASRHCRGRAARPGAFVAAHGRQSVCSSPPAPVNFTEFTASGSLGRSRSWAREGRRQSHSRSDATEKGSCYRGHRLYPAVPPHPNECGNEHPVLGEIDRGRAPTRWSRSGYAERCGPEEGPNSVRL